MLKTGLFGVVVKSPFDSLLQIDISKRVKRRLDPLLNRHGQRRSSANKDSQLPCSGQTSVDEIPESEL
jgi:hypothetical protein